MALWCMGGSGAYYGGHLSVVKQAPLAVQETGTRVIRDDKGSCTAVSVEAKPVMSGTG